MRSRTVLECVGAALLLLFPFYLPLFTYQNHILFFHGLPVTHLIGGLLVDLLFVFALLISLMVAAQYVAPSIRSSLDAMFAGIMLWGLLNSAIVVLSHLLNIDVRWLDIWKYSIIVVPIVMTLLVIYLPHITEPAIRGIRLVTAAFAFSGLWIVPQLINIAMVRKATASPTPQYLVSKSSGGPSNRIVWILFDELSYRQVIADPVPGIKFPNFDQLNGRSFSFSNVKPFGYWTDRIIPSLLLGRQFDEFRSTIGGELWYKDESTHRWFAYDPKDTLFGEAQQNGWNTGVDGWFNPYCRFLAAVINRCYTSPPDVFPIEEYGASEGKSSLSNSLALPIALFAPLIHQTSPPRDGHIQTYRNTMMHAQALIDDNNLQFVFLHLSVPHPPGIYDRQRHVLRRGGTYIDNLVLADDTLGALIQEIRASSSFVRTTLIVSSDHSWRVPMWKSSEDWSSEEERASQGQFDDRPVLLISFPGQQYKKKVDVDFPEMLEHDIIAEMLRGKISDPETLVEYISKHAH